jgi:phosphatidylserine/phosphatidylglycerophosphate/cardiolipin synthase-like enzyme
MKIIMKGLLVIYLLADAQNSTAMEQTNERYQNHFINSKSNVKRPRAAEEKAVIVPTERSSKRSKIEEFNPFLSVNGKQLQLLHTVEEHDSFFFETLSQAQESILITTYTLNYMDEDLLSLLKAKVTAGIKVWIFSEKIEENIERDLRSLRIYPCLMPIHAKILGIDNKLVALGSFNWLSEQEGNSFDPSIVVHNQQNARKILKEFWDRKADYKELLEFDEEEEEDELDHYTHKVNQNYSKNPQPLLISNFPLSIHLLSTPNQHHQFLIDCFKQAEKKIVIHSRFVSKDPQFLTSLLETLNISAFTRKGGRLEIVYQQGSSEEKILKKAFSPFANISWLPINSLHSKAIIIDEGKWATVGSYNWFSSAFDFQDDYALLETTLVFKGQAGNWLAQGLGIQ